MKTARANETNRWAIVSSHGKILHICLDTYTREEAEVCATLYQDGTITQGRVVAVTILDRREVRRLYALPGALS